MTRDIKITRIVTTHFDYQIADLALEEAPGCRHRDPTGPCGLSGQGV